METMTTGVWDLLTNSIDFLYVILCNIGTYIIISVIESIRKDWVIPTWVKRIISSVTAVFIGAVMFFVFHHSGEGIFYGFFIQFLTWDYLFKYIIDKIVARTGKKIDGKLDDTSE